MLSHGGSTKIPGITTVGFRSGTIVDIFGIPTGQYVREYPERKGIEKTYPIGMPSTRLLLSRVVFAIGYTERKDVEICKAEDRTRSLV